MPEDVPKYVGDCLGVYLAVVEHVEVSDESGGDAGSASPRWT
jgi:hypothetical protein